MAHSSSIPWWGRFLGPPSVRKRSNVWCTETVYGSDWLKLWNESRATMGEPRTHVDSKRQPIESIIIRISNFFTGKKAVASVSQWSCGRSIFTHSLCCGDSATGSGESQTVPPVIVADTHRVIIPATTSGPATIH